jgi:hypothetical protein
MLGRPSADQIEYFPTGATLGTKKEENSETQKTGWLQHHQTLASSCLGDADKQERVLKDYYQNY